MQLKSYGIITAQWAVLKKSEKTGSFQS